MVSIQLKKIIIHIFFILQKQIFLTFLALFIKINNISLNLLSFLWLVCILQNFLLKYSLISLKCIIKNTDLDLFKREVICLILIWTKLIMFIRKSSFFFRNYKLNLIRSPFVNNKTGEHLEIIHYEGILNLEKKFNILIYKYFMLLKLYVYEHSILHLTKLLL